MPDRNDEQVEIYLKSFQPLAPATLSFRIVGHAPHSRRRIAFAFGAVGCLTSAALLLIALSHRAERVGVPALSGPEIQATLGQPSTPALTRLALEHHNAFADFMTEKAQSQFPEMESKRSMLRVLAKD